MDEKKIHSIIDEAMAARDRSVSIYISPDGGVSVSVFPWPDECGGRKMFNFPTEDIVKAFEAFSEAINQLAADIVDAWEAVTVTVSAVLDDDVLWPNRYGMPPKKYGQSLQKHSKKSFKRYDYIPIMTKNLPYQRRAF